MIARRMPSVPAATGTGVCFGAPAILFWLAFLWWPHIFVLPYVITLSATAICGSYILLATFRDAYRNPRRGVRIRPIRGFDIMAGLVLTLPAMLGLYPFLPAL